GGRTAPVLWVSSWPGAARVRIPRERQLQSVRTYVRGRGDDPPRGRRRLLRRRRTAGRPEAAGPAGGCRSRRRARPELRSQGLRRPDRDERRTGPAPVLGARRGPTAHVGLLGSEQGSLRRLRRRDAARRRALDRRGVPRRSLPPTSLGAGGGR